MSHLLDSGFELWVPPTPPVKDNGLPCFEIIGTDAQFVQIPLKPGEKTTCMSGAMAYMSESVKMSVKFGGIMKTFGRIVGGGSLFIVEYTNDGSEDGYISMTPDYPGVIIPIDMREYPEIYTIRDSYLCSLSFETGVDTDVGAGTNPVSSVFACCFSGVGFIVQSIKQGDYAFLQAMGTIITKTLEEDENILVDTKSVLAFETTIKVDIKTVGGIGAMCCAGEGAFNTVLKGPGKIWMQSMSIDKLRSVFPPKVVQSGGGGDGGDGDGGGE